MKLGLAMFSTDLAMRPDELAREAEARGFECLLVPEHTHIPTATRFPRGDLPDEYKRTLDPFTVLAFAAAASERLVIGTGICLVAQHDPIVLAKTIASLDTLSGGRFVFGVGVGWNVPEMRHHGVDPDSRRTIAREKVLTMKELWTQEVASYAGKYVSLEPSWSWPKPVQRPHPPVLLGGAATPTVFKHVLDWADGWMPTAGTTRDIAEGVRRLREQADAAGRDPSTLQVTVFGAPADEAVLESYRRAGIDRAALMLPPAPRDVVMRSLEKGTQILGAMQ